MLCSVVVVLSSLYVLTAGSQPHILYVMVDDMGYDDVGYTFQNTNVSTPYFDSLAQEGLILERHYSSWLCSPSRASLLTGKHPVALGIQDDVFDPNILACLNGNEMLLPEVLRSNGYATHLVGKWHLGYAKWSCIPCARGFDTSYGLLNGFHNFYSHQFYGPYWDLYECEYDKTTDSLKRWQVLEEDGIYLNDLMIERARKVIETHAEKETGQLFMYLAALTPHSDEEGFVNVPEEFYYCNDTDDIAMIKRCQVQAMVNATEYMVKQIVGYLEAAGMWKDTLLIFISDNGAPKKPAVDDRNGELRGFKNELWEGGVRTVSFMHSPSMDILPNRGVTDSLFHISDWYETLVTVSGGWQQFEAKGGQRPPDLYSVDQTQHIIRGTTEEAPRKDLLVHINPIRQTAAYIKGHYKILVGHQQDVDNASLCSNEETYPLDESCLDMETIYLYDVFLDPGETSDLSEELPEVVEELLFDVISLLDMQITPMCTQDRSNVVEGSFPNADMPYYIPFWDNGTIGLHVYNFELIFGGF